jgi:hypothetical protein
MASRRPGGDHGPVTGPSRMKASSDRRQYWIAGLVLGVSLLAITVIVSVAADKPSTRQDTQGQLQEGGGAKPHIIPLPDSGQAPDDPGDRGGWEQLMTLGLILAGVGLVAGLVWRGTRRPRSGRRAWLAAAQQSEAERAAAEASGPQATSRASQERSPPVGSAGA